MNHSSIHAETETEILLRMATSRAALLKAARTPPVISGQSRLAASSVVTTLREAPRVTLILALCVSALVVGPRRTIGIASRAGVTAWVGGTVRNLVRKTV